MGKEKGVLDFAGAAGFDHVNGEVWHIHDLTKDKRTVCLFHLYLSTLIQQEHPECLYIYINDKTIPSQLI